MSMTTLTIFQTTGIFCTYLLVTVGLPAFVFGRKLCKYRTLERLLLYFMTGNFFVMNLVFVLQLIKMSYPITLILSTLLFVIIGKVKIDHISLKEIFLRYAEQLRRLVGGQMGIKTAIYKMGAKLRKMFFRFCRKVGFYLCHRFWDCIFVTLLMIALWYIYGNNLLEYYGYKASDLPVHNYWINALGENNIFVAGVYPHGFHCILYYLHAVFGIETYVLLRIFAFVQNVMANMVLLCVLRLCCRSRYAAYIGSFAYVAGTYFKVHTYTRFYATLPQEFGMIFILPAIYFGFSFFESRRQELKVNQEMLAAGIETEDGQEKHPRSSLCLIGFCMSFSMTLAVHFYGTMAAGLFCLAMACGYSFLLFRKKYFWKVVSTASLSVVIAVLPMLLAFLGGTPLEGSLRWGMKIIQGEEEDTEQQEQQEQQEVTVTDAIGQELAEGELISGESDTDIYEDTEITSNQGALAEGSEYPPATVLPVAEKQKDLGERMSHAWKQMEGRLKEYVFNLPYKEGVHWIMISFLGLIGLGCFYILARQACYGAMLVSTGIYMLLMCVMLSASAFGLPSLMDGNRGSIYFSYTYPVTLTFMVDGVLYFPFFGLRGKAWKVGSVLLNGLSFVCVLGFLYYTVVTNQVKSPRHAIAQEMNEAVLCLTNIIKEEKDFTWTIVSANDELRMGWDYGYHYETITFLQEMEMAATDTLIRIPTPVVYFFIEKIPLDYGVSYAGSGQMISEEGAASRLPRGNSLSVYQGERRWIVMSRMYYWAETFRKLCPNEMEVYMETDKFMCYRLEQDPYRLYNFALDYGYNQWGYR